jgi:HEAT repeat protein
VLTQYLFLSDIDRGTKQRILVALSRIRDPESVGPLSTFAQKIDDGQLRYEALFALGEIGDAAALEVVQPYTESADPHERRIATDAVAKINQKLAAAPNTQPSLIELEKVLGPRRQ